MNRLDQLCVNTLRFLSVDMIQKAASGHPGLPLGAAPMAYVLWSRHLKHTPADPAWFDRDRFILSAGHGSALLYSLLHVYGYGVSLDELGNFRQWDSLTPGHPERTHTPGVELTTGPLGQGFAGGVGMAIAEAHLAARFNRPGHTIIDHYTFGIAGDGDLMEGVAYEAASLAGHLKLGKLIYLYDDNQITLAGPADVAFTENVAERFAAMGWQTLAVADGNDLDAIDRAIGEAKQDTARPSLILIRTHIGFGSPVQDSCKAHGEPLGKDNLLKTKQNLGWPETPAFHVPAEALDHFQSSTRQGIEQASAWQSALEAYARAYPELADELTAAINGKLPDDWNAQIPSFPTDPKGLATRAASEKILNAIGPKLPALIGGSADLNPSTKTVLAGMGDFGPEKSSANTWSFAGRNIHFGVREHAMGSIMNGLAAHGGIIPYGSTFLVFSDYMRPPIRLAALMKLKTIYVFTHDSIGVGEDGPTHQPIEQLAGLRAIPGLVVIRPCDANETATAWRAAIEGPDKPVALILTRQNVPTLDRSELASAEGLERGAYILADAPDKRPDIILIASGSEVQLIVAAREKLLDKGIQARIVSMPSWELFDREPDAYRESVLPRSAQPRLAVEAGASQGWHKYIGDQGDVLGIDHFGSSAPGDRLMQAYGFSVENVCERAMKLLKK